MSSYFTRTVPALVALFAVFSPSAYAAECKDVLTNFVYNVTDSRHESFFFMHYGSAQAENNHLDTSGSGGSNIEQIWFNAGDNHNAGRQSSQSGFLKFENSDRESALLYSGQQSILRMGGSKVRLTPTGIHS
jgi:hypothetical protein